jgi:hypothetical protein
VSRYDFSKPQCTFFSFFFLVDAKLGEKKTHLHLEGTGVISRDQNIVETWAFFTLIQGCVSHTTM